MSTIHGRFGQRSEGAGGGFGCTANVSRCAVVDCAAQGRPHPCPYDGSYHRHGAIHYDCGYPKHSLQFREGDWYWICDEHYAVCREERAAFERRPKGE